MHKIEIVYNSKTGQLTYNGTRDKVLAFGMMELAKTLLNSPANSPIQVPQLKLGNS